MIPSPSTPKKTGVYWTQFECDALTGPDGGSVDWSDHVAAHKAVSRLFPQRLPGDEKERRKGAGILYRVDQIQHGQSPRVLVQSLVTPELTPQNSRTTEVSKQAWSPESGERIVFRVAVNPVRRTTMHYADAAMKIPLENAHLKRRDDGRRDRSFTKQTASAVKPEDLFEWLGAKLTPALRDIAITSHFRDVTQSGAHRLIVDAFDAEATVNDSDTLHQLRIFGVGREKAYGCGLLTVKRLSL